MEFAEWIAQGMDRGWISDVTCYVHDGPPLTDEEEAIVDKEGDLDAICIPIFRLLV